MTQHDPGCCGGYGLWGDVAAQRGTAHSTHLEVGGDRQLRVAERLDKVGGVLVVSGGEEGNGGAVGAGAAGAAATVDVLLEVVGGVVVDDEAEVADVEASRGDARRDEHAAHAGFEVTDDALAVGLHANVRLLSRVCLCCAVLRGALRAPGHSMWRGSRRGRAGHDGRQRAGWGGACAWLMRGAKENARWVPGAPCRSMLPVWAVRRFVQGVRGPRLTNRAWVWHVAGVPGSISSVSSLAPPRRVWPAWAWTTGACRAAAAAESGGGTYREQVHSAASIRPWRHRPRHQAVHTVRSGCAETHGATERTQHSGSTRAARHWAVSLGFALTVTSQSVTARGEAKAGWQIDGRLRRDMRRLLRAQQGARAGRRTCCMSPCSIWLG